MVKCSDAALMAGLGMRKKPSKRKEFVAPEEAEVVPVMPTEDVATSEIPSAPTEVQGEAEVIMESDEVGNATEAPIEQGSPLWAVETSHWLPTSSRQKPKWGMRAELRRDQLIITAVEKDASIRNWEPSASIEKGRRLKCRVL